MLAYLGYRDHTAYPLDEQITELEANLPLMEKLLAEGGDIRIGWLTTSISSGWPLTGVSSSDGQRFPVSGKIRNAQAIPRY